MVELGGISLPPTIFGFPRCITVPSVAAEHVGSLAPLASGIIDGLGVNRPETLFQSGKLAAMANTHREQECTCMNQHLRYLHRWSSMILFVVSNIVGGNSIERQFDHQHFCTIKSQRR